MGGRLPRHLNYPKPVRVQEQLQALTEMHQKVIRLRAIGQSSDEIAEEVGINPTTVSKITSSALGQNRLTELRGAIDAETIHVGKFIAEKAKDAVVKVAELMEGAVKEDVQLKAALALLDRAGYGPIQKSQVAIRHITDEDIAQVKERARALGAMAPGN